MSRHVLRNPDLVQELKFRNWIRENFPDGSAGFVAEDLDLVTRVYGSAYKSDMAGMFRLIELKHKHYGMDKSQHKTFGLIDALLRMGNPEKDRYDGYYLIQTDSDDWERCGVFFVNHTLLTKEEFLLWFEFDPSVIVEPYNFRHPLLLAWKASQKHSVQVNPTPEGIQRLLEKHLPGYELKKK